MAIVKVIEVLAESSQGWEQAVQEAIAEAAKTVRNIRSVWLENFQCKVESDRIVQYRVNAKISFVVSEERP